MAFAFPRVLSGRSGSVSSGVASLVSWSARRWLIVALAGVAAALITGIPTGIVQPGFYARMTPVTWWDYPFWALSAVLIGLTAATYVRVGAEIEGVAPDRSKRTLRATLLTAFAVGCPICNKLVAAVLGISGALTYFAPVQPLLGVISVGLLVAGLAVRLRGSLVATCPRDDLRH